MFTTLKVSDCATGLETLKVRNQIIQKRRAPLYTSPPEFHSPPSGSSISEAVSSQAVKARERMSDTGTLHIEPSDFNKESLGSQIAHGSVSRNGSISSSHEFSQYHSDAATGIDPIASEKEQQQQHRCKGECLCITKVLLAYQDINMNLNGRAGAGWNAAFPFEHNPSPLTGNQVLTKKKGTFIDQQIPVETVLHCIKSSIEICEMLMDCQNCSARSECIMLSICMCETMVARAEELVGAVDPSPSLLLSASAMDLDYGAGNKAMALDSNHILTARSGLRLGQWRLDNEDELQVIQSLLTARMTRLDSLTARMKHVAQQNEWPVHDARIGSLRERLVGAMFLARRGSYM
ncbi:hypothetical protein KVR01_013404 [Diaporthe batatas]|uniref:uncharacterized protein n=1 Tax=Diaporthe batatas TaxID=748121 RepID=UPI001D04B6DF|nr:uncharacterized protein KVR01_013404 [Diaporthe batatas]KAG8156799.1 hypothetical protein KVR01_013404 [Diaporthe batatas]